MRYTLERKRGAPHGERIFTTRFFKIANPLNKLGANHTLVPRQEIEPWESISPTGETLTVATVHAHGRYQHLLSADLVAKYTHFSRSVKKTKASKSQSPAYAGDFNTSVANAHSLNSATHYACDAGGPARRTSTSSSSTTGDRPIG